MPSYRDYFAYGSNMRLQQMADRCPSSTFKGRAVLIGFRWQINERGVANVVKSENDSVEGILYSVDASDEKRLDRNEGVSRGFYDKLILPIEFQPIGDEPKTIFAAQDLEDGVFDNLQTEEAGIPLKAPVEKARADSSIALSSQDEPDNADNPAINEIVQNHSQGKLIEKPEVVTPYTSNSYTTGILPGVPDTIRQEAPDEMAPESPETQQELSRSHTQEIQQDPSFDIPSQDQNTQATSFMIEALVYASETYCKDGKIRDEYKSRMRNAARDAERLGVSTKYLSGVICPAIGPEVKHSDPRGSKRGRREMDGSRGAEDMDKDGSEAIEGEMFEAEDMAGRARTGLKRRPDKGASQKYEEQRGLGRRHGKLKINPDGLPKSDGQRGSVVGWLSARWPWG